jgi:hypothetical protein
MTITTDFTTQTPMTTAPKPSARQITYVGCGIALTLGLALGLALRPDYAAGQASAGPRIVVSSATAR